MSTTTNRDVSIPEALFEQTRLLARQLNISQDHLVEMAVENFLKSHQIHSAANERPQPTFQEPKAGTKSDQNKAPIYQGDIYWVQLENLNDLQSTIPHPQVVLQQDILNHSRIPTVVVCGLTTNLKRANAPGNLLLEVGEANLPRQSIVEVSKVSTVAKAQLGAYIGHLSEQRVNQIFAGMRFLQRSFFTR